MGCTCIVLRKRLLQYFCVTVAGTLLHGLDGAPAWDGWKVFVGAIPDSCLERLSPHAEDLSSESYSEAQRIPP